MLIVTVWISAFAFAAGQTAVSMTRLCQMPPWNVSVLALFVGFPGAAAVLCGGVAWRYSLFDAVAAPTVPARSFEYCAKMFCDAALIVTAPK